MKRIDGATAAILAAGVGYAIAGWTLGFRPFDDTFITFRYATNLADGHGFVFNIGERVLGTTSPAWALLLAAAARLGVPMPAAALAVSLAADVITAWTISRLLRRFGAGSLAAAVGGLLFLTTFDAMSLGRSGMETSVFTAAVFGSLAAAASDRAALAGLLAGAAALLRPEGLAAVPIVMAAAAQPRQAMRAGIAAVVILTPWVLFATWYFGSPIPQSVVAKAATARDGGLTAFNWLNVRLFLVSGQYGGSIFERSFWSLGVLRTGLALVGVVAAVAAGRRAALLLVAYPVGVFAALALANAFTWFPWYYGPFHAGAALLCAFGLWRASQAASSALRGRLIVVPAAALVFAQAVVALAVKLPADHDFTVRGYLAAAAAVENDAAVRIASAEIGAIGWAARHATIVDLEGLVTPASVGHDSNDIVRASPPEYLIWRTDDSASLIAGLAADGWLDAHYVRVAAIADPFAPRHFETYRRRESP
jgi:hypothetical protein